MKNNLDNICPPHDLFWQVDLYWLQTHSYTWWSVGNEETQTYCREGGVTEWGPGCRKTKQDRFLYPSSISSTTLIILTLGTHTQERVCVSQIPSAEHGVFEQGRLLKCLIRPLFEQKKTTTYQHTAGTGQSLPWLISCGPLHLAGSHKDMLTDTVRETSRQTAGQTDTPTRPAGCCT